MKTLLTQIPQGFAKLGTAAMVAGALALSGCAATTTSQTVDTGSFSMPAYEQYQLSNGMTVYLMPQKIGRAHV